MEEAEMKDIMAYDTKRRWYEFVLRMDHDHWVKMNDD